MKKSIVMGIVIAFFVVGCGGGGSGDGNNANSNTDGDNQNSNHPINTGFTYPKIFDSDELFFLSAKREAPAILLNAYFEYDKLMLLHVINQIVGLVEVDVHNPLNMVDEVPNVLRANCEKGSLSAISYSSLNENSSFGEFEMTKFSGVGIQVVNDSESCPSSYYDGYIKYSLSDNPSTITVQYGDTDINPNPFYYSSDYSHESMEGLLGGGYVEMPNSDSFIFKTKPNQPIERRIVEGNNVVDKIQISEADISDIDDGEKTTVNANYIRKWLENGETFILSTEIYNLIYNKDKYVISGTVKYRLSVEGKVNRYVTASVSYKPDSIDVIFNKEGIETSKKY